MLKEWLKIKVETQMEMAHKIATDNTNGKFF